MPPEIRWLDVIIDLAIAGTLLVFVYLSPRLKRWPNHLQAWYYFLLVIAIFVTALRMFWRLALVELH
jgi:hypothetical protein